MNMIDVKDAGDDPDIIPITWRGLINGLVTSSSSESRIITNIDQAFVQSTYLGR